MPTRSSLGRRVAEIAAWVVAVPAIVIALVNAEIFRLVVGAFGPPPDAGMARVLALAAALAGLTFWLARRAEPADRSATRRAAGLALVSIAVIFVVLARSRDVRRRNVTFTGNGIRIGATIYEPLTTGKHPAVVFVAGSAPFKRGLYALWAEHLARIGVASIVPDKRGVGGTGGVFERNDNASKANLDLLAGDAVAALEYASTLPDIDSTRLGLFGVSQGGWIAPMAAVASNRPRFIIMVSGPTVSVREENAWSDLRGDDQRAARVSRAQAEQIIDTMAAGGVDPRSRLAALDIPGLWLFGSDDASIPTRKSVVVLDSAKRVLNKRFDFDSAPGYGHLVMGRVNGPLPSVAPSSWRALDTWVKREVLAQH